MSKLRKHVTQSALHEYPEPTSSQSIVRSVANRGTNQVRCGHVFDNNEHLAKKKVLFLNEGIFIHPAAVQFEVEYANGEKILVMMPQKFRNLIWIKRG